MSEPNQRERFEAWWTDGVLPAMRESYLWRNEYDEYENVRCQCAWETWQAAQPTPATIELHASLIAASLLGQPTEEDVREVEGRILELLGITK